MPTATQIAQGRNIPLSFGLFAAMFNEVPFLRNLDARTTSSTKFMSLWLESLPDPSPFVNYNEGFTPSEAELGIREFDCSLIGGQIKAERITARKWDKEHGSSGYSWLDLQTVTKMTSQGKALEKQAIYGREYDAKGFPGLRELTPYVTSNVLAATEYANGFGFKRSVINAGGNAANSASGVYAIIEGDMDVQLILGDDMGGGEEMFRFEDMISSNEAPNPSEPTKKTIHDILQFSGHLGLSIAGSNQTPNGKVPTQYSVRRIANLTDQVGYKLTDALLSKLYRSFGPNKKPTRLVMSSRSGEQLAASRQATAVNYVMGQTGDASRAVFNTYPEPPDNFKGVPIDYADSTILDNDPIETL